MTQTTCATYPDIMTIGLGHLRARSWAGKMGSLVGASEEVWNGRGHDSSFQEYTVSFLYLPYGLILNAYLVNQCFHDCSCHGQDREHGQGCATAR